MRGAERVLRLFPGLLAAGLAILYVLGAIATGSEFAGEGIDPQDAVPLLSVEQLLARGIGVLVRPAAFLFLFGILLFAINIVVMQLANRSERTEQNEVDGDGLKIEVGAGLLIVAGVSIAVPLNQLIGYLILTVGVWAVFAEEVLRSLFGPRWQRLAPVVFLVAVVLSEGVLAYTDPAPLGRAYLTLVDGGKREGIFVTHSDSTWYLYAHDRGDIEAFADASVRTAAIGKRPSSSSNDEKSLGSYALDALGELSPF